MQNLNLTNNPLVKEIHFNLGLSLKKLYSKYKKKNKASLAGIAQIDTANTTRHKPLKSILSLNKLESHFYVLFIFSKTKRILTTLSVHWWQTCCRRSSPCTPWSAAAAVQWSSAAPLKTDPWSYPAVHSQSVSIPNCSQEEKSINLLVHVCLILMDIFYRFLQVI